MIVYIDIQGFPFLSQLGYSGGKGRELISHCIDGTAEAAFRMDLATTRAYKVGLLPTFIVRYKGKETLLQNYLSVDDF